MRKCICSRLPTPMDSKAHNFFSRSNNLLFFVVLYTLECWPQDHADRKSFHNVSNFAPNVNLPLAWPIGPFCVVTVIPRLSPIHVLAKLPSSEGMRKK